MCKIVGCENKSRGALGYCGKHYQRLIKYGNPNLAIKPKLPLHERFWRFVDKKSNNECWPWTGQKINGYGRISIGSRGLSSDGAHRISWEIHNGQKVPSGMFVMHRCDNPECVNPAHLSIGTPKENYDDMVAKGRRKHVIPVGENNGKSVLTKEMVLEIKSSNLRNVDLARKFNVSPNCIRGVRTGRTWKHIEESV